jgi:hypothetical protein
MADNIKIVGSINSISTVSRYSSEDTNLIQSSKVQENFGGENDYIEYYIYDVSGNLLNVSYNYLNYKLPSNTGLTPGTTSPTNTTGNIQTENVGVVSTLSTPTISLYPVIEIDPVQDLQNSGYSSGEFKIQYNLLQNKISNYLNRELFIKEISQDRTEIRLASTILTDSEIENTVTNLIEEINSSTYYVDYLLNFGNNEQYVAVNIALNKAPEGYEVLFKLYEPLPLSVQEKQTLWIVEEIVNPYLFDVNLDKLITPPPPPQLRGANFDIDIPNQGTISTTYTNYSTALSSLQSLQNSSYSQILNLMNTQSIQINVDYAITSSTSFNNFVFFSSAYQRTANFYDKVKQIEDYTNLINKYTPFAATTASLRNEINLYSSSINTLISQFDGYESYLYFESSSYSWPKSGLIKPYSLLSTGSTTVISWYNTLTGSAKTYDETNYDNLEYAVPSFIKEDENNSQYLTFLNMVGHYFDNIWIYLKAITDINLANNNLNKGISKDLVYNQLQSLGIKLYNSQAGEALNQFLVGANTGSNVWNNDFSITGSYLNNIPRKDLLAELYKRIYHNLPLLLKTKGTVAGLEYLISTFGIPSQTYWTTLSGSNQITWYSPTGSSVTSSILNVKEFGGSSKSDLIKGYNNDKVRIVSNTITGSVLSPLLSLQTFPTASSQFRENDSHYVDISFSPETQMDTYISGAIASNAPTWSLDDFIGDPRQQYNNSYSDLDAQRKLYYQTGVSGFAPFTGSLLDYNGFIRLIQFFDNALFKMLGDFVPERTSLSTGVTINSPVLERNKATYANPTNTTTQSIYTAQYSASTISSQYGTFYNTLSSSNNTMGWFDGELSGSTVDIYQYFKDNPNPYLDNWNVWNSQHTITQSINQNSFAHSDWNVLLNNVSASVLSTKRKKIEYTGNFLPTGSLTSSAELQDSYLTLRSYNTSRYEGSKLTSKLYNIYTSGSYTGSDGRTIQIGDKSYGKTAAIDRQSYKVGWVKSIPSSSLNFYDKTQIQLKYLVDKDLNLTDLTLKNNNLIEVQNTFKSGDNVVLSLSDAIKPSFQKTLDGTKSIFRGGYSFDPILYRERSEDLSFRYINYNILVSSTQRIIRYEKNWFHYSVNGTTPNAQNPSTAFPNLVGASQIDYSYVGFGYRWNTNYIGWEGTNPMAATSYTTTNTTTYKYASTSFSSSISLALPSSGYTYDQSAKIYEFNLLNFNSSIDSNFDTDVTNRNSILFKAPIGGIYRIKGTIPVLITYATNLGDFVNYIWKFVGIIEQSQTNSTRDSDWTYVCSTKITSVITGDSNQVTPRFDPLTNTILTDSYRAVLDRKGILTCQFDSDNPTEYALGNRYVETYLPSGTYLRFRFFMFDVTNMFRYAGNLQFEIGKSTKPTILRNFTAADSLVTPETFIEISNPYLLVPSYDTLATTTSASLFSVYNNHLYLKDELYRFYTTSSIFVPSTETTTATYYSPVIDNFTVQPQDLIRLGSITNPKPDYYTVLEVTQSIFSNIANTEAVFISWDSNWYFLLGGSVPLTEKRSTISVKDTTSNRIFFDAVLNSTSKQFTVSGLTGTNSANNRTYTLVGGNYYIYSGGYIYMAVSDTITPTVSLNLGGQSTIRRISITSIRSLYDWGTQSGISVTFTPISSLDISSVIDITLDKYITGSGNFSQNFAILRPKPDETSIIVNFRKSLGDVSQTILVPQDANDEIKANVGTIFQQLNVDLSNQNTNITQ